MERLTKKNIGKTIKLIQERIPDFVGKDDNIEDVAINMLCIAPSFFRLTVEEYITELQNKKIVFGHY